jgi:hypothetical protein
LKAPERAPQQGGHQRKAAPYTGKLAYQPGPRAEALLELLIGSPYQKRRDQAWALLVRAGNHCLKCGYTDGQIAYSQLVSLRPGGDVRTVIRHIEALLFCGALLPVDIEAKTYEIAFFLDCNRSVAERDAYAADMRAKDAARRRKQTEEFEAKANGMMPSSCPNNDDLTPRNDSTFDRVPGQPTFYTHGAKQARSSASTTTAVDPQHPQKIHLPTDHRQAELNASTTTSPLVDSQKPPTRNLEVPPSPQDIQRPAQAIKDVRLDTLVHELAEINKHIDNLAADLAVAEDDDQTARLACAKRREEFRREKITEELQELQNGRLRGGVRSVEELSRAADEALEDILDFEHRAAQHIDKTVETTSAKPPERAAGEGGHEAASQKENEKRTPRKCVLAYIPREDSAPVNQDLIEKTFVKLNVGPGEWGSIEAFFSYLAKLEVRAVELEYAIHCMVTARMKKVHIRAPLAYCVSMILRQRRAWEDATPEERAAVATKARRRHHRAAA